MPAGKHTKASRDLANVRVQLKTGKTRGSNPRLLSPEEVDALKTKEKDLVAQMAAATKERAINRINAHTTTEADRVIESQRAANRNVSELHAIIVEGRVTPQEGESAAESLARVNVSLATLQAQKKSLQALNKKESEANERSSEA